MSFEILHNILLSIIFINLIPFLSSCVRDSYSIQSLFCKQFHVWFMERALKFGCRRSKWKSIRYCFSLSPSFSSFLSLFLCLSLSTSLDVIRRKWICAWKPASTIINYASNQDRPCFSPSCANVITFRRSPLLRPRGDRITRYSL